MIWCTISEKCLTQCTFSGDARVHLNSQLGARKIVHKKLLILSALLLTPSSIKFPFSIPPQNDSKSLGFWCFRKVWKRTLNWNRLIAKKVISLEKNMKLGIMRCQSTIFFKNREQSDHYIRFCRVSQ